jgi:hypothetical protein
MRFVSRLCFVAVCVVFAWQAPAIAAHKRVLGVVAQTDRGHLDTSNAVQGADVYSCDSLTTDEGGVLRVTVGSNQLYLSASSAAALEDDGSAIQAIAVGGTVGFSFSAADDFSVRTPAGIIRSAKAGAAAGQVAYASAKEIIISAMHGDLVLDNGGELRTIPEGKSADVTFENDLQNGCHDESAADQSQQHQNPVTHHRIGFYIIVGAAVAIPSYFLWRDAAESNSTPKG